MRGIREAIDYINEIQTTGRYRRVRLRAVPGHDDVRRPRADLGSDGRARSGRRPTRIVHRALDAGINFIDTADVYAAGESETLVGKAIAGRRHDVVLATKVRGRMGPGPNQVGLSRLHIVESVEASLKRLNTDYIDLYQIHRSDPLTNIEDTLRALDDLVRAGKVRYIGCSNLPAWQLMKALAVSREQRLERFQLHAVVLLAGRARSRARDDAAAEGSGARAAGLEPAGRRLPVRQVHARRRRRVGAPGEVRLPAGEQGEGVRDPRRARSRSRRRTASPSRRSRWRGSWRTTR